MDIGDPESVPGGRKKKEERRLGTFRPINSGKMQRTWNTQEVKMAGLKTLSCEALWIQKKKIDPEAGERKILQLGPTMIRLHVTQRKKELEIPKNQYTKWFDYDKIKRWIIHTIQEKRGLFHTFRRRKKLGRFMIDEKIRKKRLDRIPVLADRDHILWSDRIPDQ